MPLITVTVRKPKSREFKAGVLDAVHAALVSSGVPPADKFQRVIELDAEDFRFDPTYPDLKSERTPDFVLVEILQREGEEKIARRADGQSLALGIESRKRDGLLQGNDLGKLVVRRRTADSHLAGS